MRRLLARGTAFSTVMTLGACAAGSPPMTPLPNAPLAESITVSIGPCFGFCPVYDTTVGSDGRVSFTGKRHTAVLGERHREIGAAAYRALADKLARFRPAAGTEARIDCDAAISDTSSYTVTWRGPDDGQQAVATLQSRCPGGPADRLDAILRTLPDSLGIADWARQTSRPGESRG